MCKYDEKESGYNFYPHLQALTLTVPFCSRAISTLESLWRHNCSVAAHQQTGQRSNPTGLAGTHIPRDRLQVPDRHFAERAHRPCKVGAKPFGSRIRQTRCRRHRQPVARPIGRSSARSMPLEELLDAFVLLPPGKENFVCGERRKSHHWRRCIHLQRMRCKSRAPYWSEGL